MTQETPSTPDHLTPPQSASFEARWPHGHRAFFVPDEVSTVVRITAVPIRDALQSGSGMAPSGLLPVNNGHVDESNSSIAKTANLLKTSASMATFADTH